MQASHYGHVIKHLEVSHLSEVPVIEVEPRKADYFTSEVRGILDRRDQAAASLEAAEAILSKKFGLQGTAGQQAEHSTVQLSEFARGRRRLEAAFHSPDVRALTKLLHKNSTQIDRLGQITDRVWWMTRFSRNFGEDGVPYMSADELFAVSQVGTKRVYLDPIPNSEEFFVKEGWLLMACSGQIYGLNGSVTMATRHDESFFFSHDLIRIAPEVSLVKSGYLFAYLGHPQLGQRLIKRTAYGSSVPHIDPGDVERIPIARLEERVEHEIAEHAEDASRLKAEADELERRIGREADDIVKAFIG